MNDEEFKDKVLEKLTKLEVISEKNRSTLVEHARRSTASEGRLDVLEAFVRKIWVRLEKHLSFVRGVIWVLGGLFGTGGLIWLGVDIYLKTKGIK